MTLIGASTKSGSSITTSSKMPTQPLRLLRAMLSTAPQKLNKRPTVPILVR